MTKEYTPTNITSLKENEVFVFGSNRSGFHGAGASGFACRGDAKNTWRQDQWFLEAMRSSANSPNRIGRWAIYGQAQGFMQGKEGKAYAIVTIERPGLKRSTSLSEIESQINELIKFALVRSDLKFYVTQIGCNLAGYDVSEIRELFLDKTIPDNIILPKDFF